MTPRPPVSRFRARSEPVIERIRRLGFRRWHERELIAGHGWLVVCFVSMIMVAAGLELLSIGEGVVEFLADSLLVGGGGWLGWFAWRRYRAAMQLAGSVSEQAVCARCGHYGFRAGEARGERLRADCPRCDNHWWVSAGRELNQARP